MKPQVKSLLSILFGVLITLCPAIYNHYVLLFTDSQIYITCGNELSFTEDRSFVYGWFVGFSSLHKSLWLTIIAQSLIFNWVCYSFVKQLAKHNTDYLYIPLIALLSIFSALAWDVSHILPDIFSAIAIMLLVILVRHKKPFKTEWYLLFVTYLLVLQMHFSFMLYNCLAMVILFLMKLINPQFDKNKYVLLCILLGVFINIGLFTLEKKVLGSDKFSKVSHVFLMGKLVENGVLKEYLDEVCVTKKYEICQYKDSLAPNNYSGNFIFHPSSAFQKTGAWNNPHIEYNVIIRDILFTPKYLVKYTKAIIAETIKLFNRNEIGSSIFAYPIGGWGPHPAVAKYYTNEMNQYKVSLQNTNTLYFPFGFMSGIYKVLLLLSVIGLMFYVRSNLISVCIAMVGIVSNALVTGGLVGLEDRYATRQNYLVILLLLIFVSNSALAFYKKKAKK